MTESSSDPRPLRLARVREHLREAGVDTLLVGHPPNLEYLTGLRASSGVLLLDADRVRLIVDFRYAEAAAVAIAGLEPAGGSMVLAERSLDEAAAEAIKRSGGGHVGIEAAHLSVKRRDWLAAALGGRAGPFSLVPTERLVERERLVKGSEEVASLREAGRRLASVARDLARWVRAGQRESDIAAELDHAVRLAGFDRPAFDTIVASGPRSAMPHARPGGRILASGDAVVLDFGGVYDGYCVDLTRTASVGPPGPDLERCHRAVLDAVEAALAVIRPGRLASAVDEAARQALARHGLEGAFGHSTGHGLGLEVHEEPRVGRPVGGVPPAVLEPGMAFTVEPGVYLPGLCGVRVEDDVVVTPDGYELLTDAPRSLIVV